MGISHLVPGASASCYYDEGDEEMPGYSRDELGEVMWTVYLWVRAIWHDHDTAAALALTHPATLPQWPATDIGEWIRDQFPWLGDEDVEFVQPREVGADLEVVDVEVGSELAHESSSPAGSNSAQTPRNPR